MSYPVNSVTLELECPIEFNGEEIKKIDVRRPKVRDQIIAQKIGGDSIDKEVKLFSLLTNSEPEMIHELFTCDYHRLQDIVTDFELGKSAKK